MSATTNSQGKVTGQQLGNFHGLTVTVELHKAKKTGKDRIWVQIRQKKPKRWRVAENLSYMRAVDIQFEDA